MKIQIAKGNGSGPTELAAFDQALVNTGVANYNLIYLSSVLPPDSDIEVCEGKAAPVGEWGDRLYVVMAQERTSRPNQEVWAGIGWIQDPKTKRGLLVEHYGHSESEIRADIENSLQGLAANRGADFGPIHMAVTGVKCEDKPVCALVIATFESTSWKSFAGSATQTRLQRLANKISGSR
ncbi:MAG TPA: pyruvoyl-dependent arginine decarboxylase [Candidatus Saccharimonadales bacterium]|nr:pyruvoyl-dependent arginine decarboxylase [Candidatus Saccharimonadales bacterium]